MVLGVFVLGVIYAMPNFYPPDYAIQISRGSGGLDLSERELDVALEALHASNRVGFGVYERISRLSHYRVSHMMCSASAERDRW